MNPDPRWQRLLAQSKPTYQPETEPPYGFVTRTLAQLRTRRAQQDVLERIGLRALWVSLGTFAAIATVTFLLSLTAPVDPDRSVERFAEVDTISYS